MCSFITRCPIFEAAIRFKSTGIFTSVCKIQLTASAVASFDPKGEGVDVCEIVKASANHVFRIEKRAEDGAVAEATDDV